MLRKSKDWVEEMRKSLESRVIEKSESGDSQNSIVPECSICQDKEWIKDIPEGATLLDIMTIPVHPCVCHKGKTQRREIKRLVPEMWQGLRLSSLKPSNNSELVKLFPYSQQQEVIKDLQDYPYSGHVFIGPSGTGKSRFLHCLLQEAILDGKRVFFSKMSKLIKAMQDNEFKNLPEERWSEMIDAADLKANSSKKPLYIFIDEMDKIKPTDDVYLKFFDLIDFIYENRSSAILTICTNLSEESLGEVWGLALARRIITISKPHYIGEEE